MEKMVDNEDQAKDFTSWNHVYVKTNKSNLHIMSRDMTPIYLPIMVSIVE